MLELDLIENLERVAVKITDGLKVESDGVWSLEKAERKRRKHFNGFVSSSFAELHFINKMQ